MFESSSLLLVPIVWISVGVVVGFVIVAVLVYVVVAAVNVDIFVLFCRCCCW